jgi:cell division protein FtsL
VQLAALALLLVASMLVSLRRTAGGRKLSESLNALAREEVVLRTQLAEELVRVDSLSSRERILEVAAGLGLRSPEDREIINLPDVTR